MIKKVPASVDLTSGQYEVLQVIAALKGVTIKEYIASAIIDGLFAEIDHHFEHGDKWRYEYYTKIGASPVFCGVWK